MVSVVEGRNAVVLTVVAADAANRDDTAKGQPDLLGSLVMAVSGPTETGDRASY